MFLVELVAVRVSPVRGWSSSFVKNTEVASRISFDRFSSAISAESRLNSVRSVHGQMGACERA
ncbi:hypothetical protein ACFC18_37590 [Streptomyces sp. NPDC056121]|uniref:hypothetical protein n=1 Tax=unclassified Streptomyces TaxID=2593676 RepID=UPI0033E7052E